jgi:hypothetical protein
VIVAHDDDDTLLQYFAQLGPFRSGSTNLYRPEMGFCIVQLPGDLSVCFLALGHSASEWPEASQGTLSFRVTRCFFTFPRCSSRVRPFYLLG